MSERTEIKHNFNLQYGNSDQENFIINILNKKTNGYYVELGANHPIEGSNTYYLEKEFSWKGVALEILPEYQSLHSKFRNNPCLLTDARKFDYKKYFIDNNFPKQIDFLQIDIDAGFDTNAKQLGDSASSLHGLIQIPLSEYRFTIITYEHEALNDFKKNSERDAQREILDSYGYSLVVRNWHEDWWVDPNVVPYTQFKHFYKMAAP